MRRLSSTTEDNSHAVWLSFERKLLRLADFNVKLRERGVDKKAIERKICGVCTDEKDVRSVLDEIWQNPFKGQEILAEALNRNKVRLSSIEY